MRQKRIEPSARGFEHKRRAAARSLRVLFALSFTGNDRSRLTISIQLAVIGYNGRMDTDKAMHQLAEVIRRWHLRWPDSAVAVRGLGHIATISKVFQFICRTNEKRTSS